MGQNYTVSKPDSEEWTALHYACCDGNKEHILNLLLESDHVSYINHQTKDGQTPMMTAGKCHLTHVIRPLLTKGAELPGLNKQSAFSDSEYSVQAQDSDMPTCDSTKDMGLFVGQSSGTSPNTWSFQCVAYEGDSNGSLPMNRFQVDDNIQIPV